MKGYIPQQRGLVWIDFSPSTGKEIRKSRPAVVVSPITSRNYPSIIKLEDKSYKIKGEVLTHQIKSLGFKKRDITCANKLSALKWIEIKEKIEMIF